MNLKYLTIFILLTIILFTVYITLFAIWPVGMSIVMFWVGCFLVGYIIGILSGKIADKLC